MANQTQNAANFARAVSAHYGAGRMIAAGEEHEHMIDAVEDYYRALSQLGRVVADAQTDDTVIEHAMRPDHVCDSTCNELQS